MLCRICGCDLIEVGGYKSSQILLVGEFPGVEEVRRGMPWCGNAGHVLAVELAKQGIQMERCKLTNLWRHEVPQDKASREIEFPYHFELLFEELKKVKAVLLMGSELAELFFDKKITYINGADMISEKLPRNIEVSIAAFNPAMCLQREAVVGDFRFAVQRFAQAVKEIK